MIADANVKARRAERSNLMLDKVRPRVRQIRFAAQILALFLRFSRHVFVDFVNGAQVAQMPIERRLISCKTVRRNGGHYDIAAVARVSGNNESPRAWFRLDEFILLRREHASGSTSVLIYKQRQRDDCQRSENSECYPALSRAGMRALLILRGIKVCGLLVLISHCSYGVAARLLARRCLRLFLAGNKKIPPYCYGKRYRKLSVETVCA